MCTAHTLHTAHTEHTAHTVHTAAVFGDDFKVYKRTTLQVADICAVFPSCSLSSPCGCAKSPLVVDVNIINIPLILKLQQYEQQFSNLQKCHTAGFSHLCNVPIFFSKPCCSVPSGSFCTRRPMTNQPHAAPSHEVLMYFHNLSYTTLC